MTYEDRCELEEMFMGFVTRNEEPSYEDRLAHCGWEDLEDPLVFDDDRRNVGRMDGTCIKFRVADGKCSTVKTLDTLEEAIEFCDKYYLPYGLIIRLENGVQVSDYGEYEYGEEREETARASAEWFDKGFTMGWNMDNINLPSKELLEECWVERHGTLPFNNPEGQRDCLQEGLDNVSKALGLPYKTVRFMELRNRTVIMCVEK